MSKQFKVLLIHGPNFGVLELRESDIYGSLSLAQIEDSVKTWGKSEGLLIEVFQSNSEGSLVDTVNQATRDRLDGIIVNAGAYTHTSIALYDAFKAFSGCIVEVHLSNIFRREEFRQHSYISRVATGTISGFGLAGYKAAVGAMAACLSKSPQS